MGQLENVDDISQASFGIAGAGLSLLIAAFFYIQVSAAPFEVKERGVVPERYQKLGALRAEIQAGAIAFLKTEYTYLAAFVVVIAIALGVILIQDDNEEFGLYTAICFVVGALFSASAGWAGMYVATSANARTTTACAGSSSEPGSLAAGLKVSFASGAVMSFTVVGLGLLGLSVLFLIFEDDDETWNYLSGFGFGASSIALFARVAGGVFTKAADVGADLVGKTEAGIPEDDPRNPAVIADNVGDNVGDVAGMGADLFESFVGSIIATATLATSEFTDRDDQNNAVALPFWIAGCGVVSSFFGVVYVRSSKLDANASLHDLLSKLRTGIFVAGVFVIGLSIMCCSLLFTSPVSWKLVGCIVIGLFAGVIVGTFTEYCTSYEETPTQDIASASVFGPAPVIIKGLGVGMLSVVIPSLVLGGTIIGCNFLSGLYGVSLSAVGMLSTLGITLATDAYGPVADNAGGLAEMAEFDAEIRQLTDTLDSLGNTTAATGKGFAIGSAVLTSVGLLVAFMEQSGLKDKPIDLKEPVVLTGLLIGAMLPFVFAALTMLSVDKSARAIITEVRHQFAIAPELLKGAEKQTVNGHVYPDSSRCVEIASTAAIQEMLLPGALAVFTPPAVGFLMGTLGLAGLLGGSLTSGFMLALTMANAGGAWDNSKKWVEKCGKEGEPVTVNGVTTLVYYNYGMKPAKNDEETARIFDQLQPNQYTPPNKAASTENPMRRGQQLSELIHLYKSTHSAAVTGDTVGDPFKDTSGPALNILIKLMSVVSLVLAPAFKSLDQPDKGFGEWGVIIAILIICGTTFFLALLLRYYQRVNAANTAAKERKAEEEFAKIRADKAKEGSAAAPVDSGEVKVDAHTAAL